MSGGFNGAQAAERRKNQAPDEHEQGRNMEETSSSGSNDEREPPANNRVSAVTLMEGLGCVG